MLRGVTGLRLKLQLYFKVFYILSHYTHSFFFLNEYIPVLFFFLIQRHIEENGKEANDPNAPDNLLTYKNN